MGFQFGDVLQNEMAGKNNPYYQSIFLRKTNKFIYVMEFDGKLGEFYNDNNNKITKVGSVIDDEEMNRYKENMRQKKREWKLRK